MVTIRTARTGDAAGIANVYVEAWRDAYAGMIPDRVLLGMSRRQHASIWSRALANDRNREDVIVAVDGPVVGFGSCGRARGAGLPHQGEVYTLYVLPGHQGRGIGKSLLASLFGALRANGWRSALIWVLADNPARFFYHAMGGVWIAVREEKLWGTTLREMAYGWTDLEPRSAPGS